MVIDKILILIIKMTNKRDEINYFEYNLELIKLTQDLKIN